MSKAAEKRPRGRPPKDSEAMLERINIRVPVAMMDEIRRISDERMDKPDLASVIRELLAESLQIRARKK